MSGSPSLDVPPAAWRRTLSERAVLTFWPSVGATATGRVAGRILAWDRPGWAFFRPGLLLAPLLAPLLAGLYFAKLAPVIGRRYQVSTSRVAIFRGWPGRVTADRSHDGYDDIDVEVRAGQAWFASGDLVFRQHGEEVFRLPGVSRPEIARAGVLAIQRTKQSLDRTAASIRS